MKSNRKNWGTLIAAVAVVVLLAGLGWWAGETGAKYADAEMRERLLRHAVDIARIINPEVAKKLTFTPADKGMPGFEHIREQMTLYGKTFPQRGIYSMVLREGKIFFGPENYPENDPMASPPGTEYKQPPAEYLPVFKDKRPVTVGPVTDEFGTFVSALAPALDPHGGKVLMVVGVDILASDWQARLNAARRGPLVAMLALMLLLSGGAVAVRRRNRRMKAGTLKLKVWIVAPTALAILAGLAIYGVFEYREFNEAFRREMLRTTEQAGSRWNRNIASEVQILKAQIDHIASNPAMLKAWQDRDLSMLTDLSQPVHEQLKREYRITHFYFMAPDRTCFLRAHQPDRRGDLIDRSTLLTAERTGEDSWGIELGPLGTFTLRYVRPWTQEGQTTGYLELGMEIEHLAGQLAGDMNIDLMTVIRKEYTTREKFEAGRQAFGFAGQWDAYPDFVVAHQTTSGMPQEVARWLQHDHHYPAAGNEVFYARLGERRFACGVIHLPDAAGRGVGDLIMMRDVTAEAGAARVMLLLNLGLAVVLFGGVLVLLWSVTGAAERQLSAAFAQVRESDSRMRAITDSAQDAILMMDPEGRISFWNPAAERIFGYNDAEAIGQTLHKFLAPKRYLEAHHAVFPAFRQTGEGAAIGKTLDLEARRKDGKEIAVQLSLSAIHMNGGWHAVGILRDITERKQAEEAIRKAHERMEMLLDSIPLGVLVIDKNTHSIVDANPEACLMIGAPVDQIVGRTCRDFVCTAEAGSCPVSDLGKTIEKAEGSLITADGTKLPILRTVVAMQLEDEEWLIECFADISEMKRSESERIEREKLQAIVETAGAVCHEMNQPLMAISGYSELMQMQMDEDNPLYPYAKKIGAQVERMGGITKKLMTITSHETKTYLDTKILDLEKASANNRRSNQGNF